jgi:hemoglobin
VTDTPAEPAPTPFDRIGGTAAIAAIVDRFYDLMEQAPEYAELRALHQPDLGPMRASLTAFLSAWLGGPRTWFAMRPGTCIMSMHRSMALSHRSAAQWLDAMRRALADNGVEPALEAQMRQAFARMAHGMILP